jgi:hypothetical protein
LNRLKHESLKSTSFDGATEKGQNPLYIEQDGRIQYIPVLIQKDAIFWWDPALTGKWIPNIIVQKATFVRYEIPRAKSVKRSDDEQRLGRARFYPTPLIHLVQ